MNTRVERHKQNPLSLWERVRVRAFRLGEGDSERRKPSPPATLFATVGGKMCKNMGMILCLFLLAFLSGCGNRIPVTPVTGMITLNGDPVENAMITYIPNTSGTVATATTDKEGKYALKTYIGDKTAHGAFPGGYKVTVVKRVQKDFPDIDLKNLTPEEEEALSNQVSATLKGRAPKYEYLVPQKYESQQTSGSTAEVLARGKFVLDFELE